MNDLASVEFSQKIDGSWMALHTPSGRSTHGLSQEEAAGAMRQLLEMKDDGSFHAPLTHHKFPEGPARDMALFLEGEVSDMLKLHSGYARLEEYDHGLLFVRLGGGCKSCPSSTLTLLHGVKEQLLEKFGDAVEDVFPVDDDE